MGAIIIGMIPGCKAIDPDHIPDIRKLILDLNPEFGLFVERSIQRLPQLRIEAGSVVGPIR
jgi:hypothetical protein